MGGDLNLKVTLISSWSAAMCSCHHVSPAEMGMLILKRPFRGDVTWLWLVHRAAAVASAAGYSQSMVLYTKPRSARGTGYPFHATLPVLNVCQVLRGEKKL